MNLHLLNVTSMSARRKDGHPSVYYLGSSIGPPSLHRQDCSHWYLPGVPDSWNELLYTLLLKWESVHAQNLTESSQATPWLHRKLSVLTNVIKERQFIDQRLLFPQTNQQNHHLLSWLWCVRFQVIHLINHSFHRQSLGKFKLYCFLMNFVPRMIGDTSQASWRDTQRHAFPFVIQSAFIGTEKP